MVAGGGKGDLALDEDDRKLRLGARERQSQLGFTCKEWSFGEFVEQLSKANIIQNARVEGPWHDRLLATLGPKHQGPCDVSAERVEQREIIASRDTERARRCRPLCLFGQQAGKERTRLTTSKSLLLFGK